MSNIHKFKILETIKNLYSTGTRIIKGERFGRDNHDAVQYHSGNEDYCPTDNTNAIAGAISNNLASSVVYLYKDQIARIAKKGEKRIYSTDENGSQVVAEIFFKSNGKVLLKAISSIDIESDQAINLKSKTLKVEGNPDFAVGWTGVFSSGSGQSVTVTNGIITEIA